MALSFRPYTFHVGDEYFMAHHFYEQAALSVFRERDQQFLATYALDPAAPTSDGHPGHWQSIHTGISLTLLKRLELAVTALPLEQADGPPEGES